MTSEPKKAEPAEAAAAPSEAQSEPASIWLFVGIILCIYGVLVVLSDFLPHSHTTVLAEIRPALWWGAITTACGAVLLGIGLRQLKEGRKSKG